MASTINASTSSGIVQTADTSGVLQLQTNGTATITINTSGAVGVGSSPGYGTSGQVLTSAGTGAAPTWSTPSVSAMTLLNTLTASNNATLSDATSLTSAYDLYMFEFENIVPATDSQPFYIRVSTNGGSSYLATGYVANWTILGGNVSNEASTIAINIGGATATTNNIANTAGYGLSGTFYLTAPSSTTVRKYIWGSGAFYGYNQVSAPGLWTYQHTGLQNSNTSINAIQFLFASGNITSGKVRIYGIKTS